MSNGTRINAPHLVVGFSFLLLGVLLFLDRMGVLEFARALEYWPLLLVLFGLSMIVQAARAPAGARTDFPAGPIIVLVLITLVASRMIDSPGASAGRDEAADVRLSAILGGRRAAVSDTFQNARLTSVMGGTVLDLRKAQIPPGQDGSVDLFTIMGGAVIHVPAHWAVDVQSTVVMGGVKDERNETTAGRQSRARGSRRAAGFDPGAPAAGGPPPERPELPDLPELRELPEVPEVPEPPEPPELSERRRSQEPSPPGDAAPPGGAGDPSSAPRLVVRGFVMMGGLTIKP